MRQKKNNIDIYTDATTGYSLQERLSKSLNSLYRLDELYYALTDLLSRKIPVPAVALNAIIMGSGRRGNLDRAFATFQESQSMFMKKHDIFAYNALLFATARSRNPSVINLLSVYEEMEKNDIYPNHISFSILFELIGEVGNMTGFDEIKNHMISSGTVPTDHSIRRVLTKLAKHGNFEQVDQLVKEFYPDEFVAENISSSSSSSSSSDGEEEEEEEDDSEVEKVSLIDENNNDEFEGRHQHRQNLQQYGTRKMPKFFRQRLNTLRKLSENPLVRVESNSVEEMNEDTNRDKTVEWVHNDNTNTTAAEHT